MNHRDLVKALDTANAILAEQGLAKVAKVTLAPLSEAAKNTLKRLHTWGNHWARIDRDSINQAILDVLCALEKHGYMECHWADVTHFHLTPKGHLAAIELKEEP